jgi:hypothetical protein
MHGRLAPNLWLGGQLYSHGGIKSVSAISIKVNASERVQVAVFFLRHGLAE